MRNILSRARTFLIAILCSTVTLTLQAQTTLTFTVSQPPALIVDAGINKSIKSGEQIILGGEPTAAGGSGTFTYAWVPVTGLSNPSIANPTARPTSTTTYTLTVSDGTKCSVSSTVQVIVDGITGIKDMSEELGIAVYPNPSNGSFFLTTDKHLLKGRVLVEIYNPVGKLIHSEAFIGHGEKLHKEIRINTNVRGIYLLRLTGEKLHVIQKIAIQ
ncbi:T9SS type A sorting domain-containing protein [Pontibacter burrus]|uniref:T9SS type A sorting domain-containing protein n=1 Tax=Pontibacter burrus TaxID=2704466 RepID=A0A6B3LWF0_9BACT|nr:T9SS type A sorting domain-containing protein [Pontibacter burrus]NEM97764.1 T9SS type A sorting domain-containing protein [Pontibacter burrus]